MKEVVVGSVWSFVQAKPLHRRVWVLTTVLVVAAIVVSNVAGYVALQATLVRASQSLGLRVAADLVPGAAASVQRDGRLGADVAQAGGVVVEAATPNGRVLRASEASPELVLEARDLAVATPGATPSRRTGVDSTGARYSVVAVPLADTGYALVVARPLRTVLEILRTERLILGCVVAIGLVGAAVAAWFVVRSALRPVRQLTAAVRHVTETKDFQPVSIAYASGDLAVLAAAFNELLRTVTVMRERQARLVADAGHELRTPLTSLTTNVDLLRADQHTNHLTPVQEGEILGDVRAQLIELNGLVGDLIHLAKDDTAGAFAPLDLRDPIQAALERVQRRGPDRLFAVDLDEFHLIGDAASLERAVTNLLDNAVKWSPAGSTIHIELHGNRLTVADGGPGIPEEDLPYVFDRFFRGATGRRMPGTGLGLSIVAKTVADHGGTITAGRSQEGGACFTIQLPGVTHPDALPRMLIRAA